jgi:hypothetical protein
MERKLSLWQRIDLRTHLILCGFCRRFQANVLAIRKLAKSDRNYDASEKLKLSVEAKARIRNAIREHSG